MQSHDAVRRGRSTRGRRPSALVFRDPTPDEAEARVDWSGWYLTDEEDMGEAAEQGEIIRTLLSCMGQLADERRWKDVYCAGNQFFAWIKQEPLVRVSPDVYLLDHPPSPPRPKMWHTWLPGHNPPRFALEIVSDDWKKDYEDNPPKYAQLGTRELVIFDPEAAAASAAPGEAPGRARGGRRVPVQIYRRHADGAFVREYIGAGPVLCEELGAYLVTVLQPDGAVRLRLARDAAGTDLVPTAEERARAQAVACERAEERARAEASARERAEARIRELEQELRKARR
jgi:hypothetical protein